MRIHTACLVTETNTFAPTPTGWNSFAELGVFERDASLLAPTTFGQSPLGAWRRLAQADGFSLSEGLAAYAQPAGRTIQVVYEKLRDLLLEKVRDALPLDIVLLDLHGAMASVGTDDCTGDIVACVRAVTGPDTIIGVELDPHCQVTDALFAASNIVVCYKEYPHTDVLDRAKEVYGLAVRAARREIRPTTGLFDCRMIGAFPTIREPMAGFVQRMKSLEGKNGILSISLGHGFPWSDVAACGVKLWVIADNDQAAAASLSRELGRAFFSLRKDLVFPQDDLDASLDAALSSQEKPWILADVADNAGGGAPGDSTFILRRLLERGVSDTAIGCIADPAAVALCADAGIGAQFSLRLGGKLGVSSGNPLDLDVRVENLVPNHAQGPDGGRVRLGAAAWLSCKGIDIAICERRAQVLYPDAFGGLGIDLTHHKVVVVKSSQHFQAAFAPLAAEIRYVSTPGALDLDFANLPYKVRDKNYWPRSDDPWATST